MGRGYFPIFDKKFVEDELFSDNCEGKALAKGMARFDEICVAKGISRFSTFCGPDEEELAAMAADLDEGETLDGAWFSCAVGLRTVRAIIDALDSEKQWSKGFRPREIRHFLEELRKLEESLSIAKKKRAKFVLGYF